MLPTNQILQQIPADRTVAAPEGRSDQALEGAAPGPQDRVSDRQIYRRGLRLATPDMTTRTTSALHRQTVAEIDLAALRSNLAAVRALAPKADVLAVVKANGYGHGAVPVAKALAASGVTRFGVALVEEGLELRDAGIDGEIIVMDGAYGDYDELLAHRLTPFVFLPEHLEGLSAAARRAKQTVKAHLKLDTGMGRIGVPMEEFDGFLARAKAFPEIVLDGLVSHFANADLADQELTRLQLARFRQALATMRMAGHPATFRHLSNSAGVMDLAEAKDGVSLNLVRPGIMLYGEYPAERLTPTCALTPILTWKTRIVQLKRVAKGAPVSYGGRWIAPRDSLIATLPVGYADGYNRKLTNVGEVLVRGKRAPIAGTVCMDMCMADVTAIAGVSGGDEVVLLGAQQGERITAQEIATRCGTIHYEILCAVGARVPRVVVGQ